MPMEVVNIHSFNFDIQKLNLVINYLDIGLAYSFIFFMIKFNNRSGMVIPDIWHSIEFGSMILFMS